MFCLDISDRAIITINNLVYCWIIHGISKSESVYLLGNYVLDDHGYIYKMHIQKISIKGRVYSYCVDNLVEAK